ncbi:MULTISPECIES: hypothetical protein [unclassified Pseudomonas]|uniref:hypothetical protein n=1 Tax=unclassified Pseudomonas TaxID=196821 RepID=UPI002362FB23|nr:MULTISPECIES: hypothetical protein [unclassified Pseudomonas]
MHYIVAGEKRRAEALLEKYLGLPPSTLDLAVLNLRRFKNVAPAVQRTVIRLQSLMNESSLSQEEIAFIINAVDFLEQEANRPRQNSLRRFLNAVERKLRFSPAISLLRHCLALGSTLYGVAYCNGANLDAYQVAYYIAMVAYVIVSSAMLLNIKLRSGFQITLITAILTIVCGTIPFVWEPAGAALILALVSFVMLGIELGYNSNTVTYQDPPTGYDSAIVIDHEALANPYVPSIMRSTEDVLRYEVYGVSDPAPNKLL